MKIIGPEAKSYLFYEKIDQLYDVIDKVESRRLVSEEVDFISSYKHDYCFTHRDGF